MIRLAESFGRSTVRGIDEIGLAAALLGESLYWLIFGARRRQPVRLRATVGQMMQIGIEAMPIATLLSITIGLMLAIQSLYTLRLFGAESFAYIGIALSVTREFAPLIIGILIAGRSGSALAARLSTMHINQEVDALQVMGINPVRYLVAPVLVGMLIMLPALTVWAGFAAIFAAGIFVSTSLDTSFAAFIAETVTILKPSDLLHGIGKSALFAVLIVLVGVVNGASVTGGAEGVGRTTTRAVVQSITAIVIADMLFALLANQ